MPEAYGLLGLAAGLFALIAWLAYRSETTKAEGLTTAIIVIALIAAILFGATAWFAWREHQCQDPRYVFENPGDCV
jgi:hypothetical protein